MSRVFLDVGAVAERYAVSNWSIYEWARTAAIPCRKIGGRLRFVENELEEWEDGAELETVKTPSGRVVRPVQAVNGRRTRP